jgi:hypothetical protein
LTGLEPLRTLTRRSAAGRLLLAVLVLPLAGIASLEALFAPKAELWPRWQAHDPASGETVDHAVWDRLLGRYLARDETGLNRFDYGAVSAADRSALDGYLAALAARAVGHLNRDEQRAYWINLYNALTVQVVLAHYPVESIRDIDISPGLFASGPWDKALIAVEGEDLTLNHIEHRILRPIWRDPRIHYAVNCASVGCPNLQTRAFTAANTEALLEAAARDYVNSPRGLVLADGGLTVSSIYVWFNEDFGGSDAGVIAHLARFAAPELAARFSGVTAIAGHAYDWRLNDAE